MADPDPIQLLVHRAQGGDRTAFGEVFELYRRRLRERIRARTGPKAKQVLYPEAGCPFGLHRRPSLNT